VTSLFPSLEQLMVPGETGLSRKLSDRPSPQGRRKKRVVRHQRRTNWVFEVLSRCPGDKGAWLTGPTSEYGRLSGPTQSSKSRSSASTVVDTAVSFRPGWDRANITIPLRSPQ